MAIAKRKKRFYEVEIPLIRKTTQLQAFDKEELNDKYLKYDLTRILKGKSAILQAKITADSETAIASPTKLTLLPYYIKRMVRKGTNYVEDSFTAECKDETLKIKPLLVTRRKVSRAVRKSLRNKTKEEIINYVKTINKDDLFEEILSNKFQKQLSQILKKIYPLSLCEIRILKVENKVE